MPPEHAWAAYQYDMAAMRLGAYVDLGLSMTDKQGQRLHTLSALLAERDEAGRLAAQRYRTDFDRFPVAAA